MLLARKSVPLVFVIGVPLMKIEPSFFSTAFWSHAVAQPQRRPPHSSDPEHLVAPAQQYWPAPPQLQVPPTHWNPVLHVVPSQQACEASPQVHDPPTQVRLELQVAEVPVPQQVAPATPQV